MTFSAQVRGGLAPTFDEPLGRALPNGNSTDLSPGARPSQLDSYGPGGEASTRPRARPHHRDGSDLTLLKAEGFRELARTRLYVIEAGADSSSRLRSPGAAILEALGVHHRHHCVRSPSLLRRYERREANAGR